MSPLKINYDSPAELRAFLDSRGLGMRKKFGQNFLVNPHARSRLLDALEFKAGDEVWEVGPGLGAMTAGLLERGAHVTAFEIDPAFSLVLREEFGDQNEFLLAEGDVLKTWQNTEGGDFLLGNLPYNIAAILLADFIEKKKFFTRMVVTVQREVAQRMMAKPGSRDYSSFSVLCSSAYKVSPLMVLKGASFYPAPKVDSQGVRFDLLDEAGRKYSRLFQPLTRALFSSRRKTIKNNLINFSNSVILNGMGTEAALEALTKSGISGDRRAETLDTADFAGLAQALEDIIDHG
ncbi:ribosomal RNA small subunit methyltransferase A [Spirochaetia bacterium]|nr:ribosomal RNA small subunit methyltransferase A [Spirochaetia bacterium]